MGREGKETRGKEGAEEDDEEGQGRQGVDSQTWAPVQFHEGRQFQNVNRKV